MELVLFCLKLFFGRILDVSLGTARTILMVRGKTVWAALCGFFEAVIWLLIVRDALTGSAGGWAVTIAYAGGFASGTFVGGKLSNKLIKGNLEVQIVTSSQNDALVHAIRSAGFAISVINVNPSEYSEEKHLIIAEIENRRLEVLRGIVHSHDPKPFITVRETRLVYNGFFKKK